MIERRRFLATAAALPVFWVAPPAFAGARIHHLRGGVYVNHRRVDAGAIIRPGDAIVTSADGLLEFSLGGDAFRLGPRTALELDGAGETLRGALRLLTGTLLGVFGQRRERLAVTTAFATVGIRGTGVFLDARPGAVYACTCYGTTEIAASGVQETVTAHHHAPRLLSRTRSGTIAMEPAPMRDHDDDMLRRLESLVGRVPPFDAA